MDSEAEALWRSRRPPFDGATMATRLLSRKDLVSVLGTLVPLLRSRFPATSLTTAEDWHEHDGFVETADPTSWDELESAIADERAVEACSPKDEWVRRAWLAGDGSFYLRWYHYEDESDDPPIGGNVDLTAHLDVIEVAANALAERAIDAEVSPAGRFFDAGWGG